MAKEKLTKRVVDALQPSERDQVVLDTDIKGFGVKVTPKGKKSYFLFYRTSAHIQRRPTIGEHGSITTEQARIIAREWKAEIAKGCDPSLDRKYHRQAPTMKELCQRFLTEHSVTRNKHGTYYNYDRLIERFVLPKLGQRKVIDISRDDITRLHTRLAETPYQANRLLGLISKLMNMAEKWGYRNDGSNPCRHVEKFPEGKRERYLSSQEIKRLGQVLSDDAAMKKELPSVSDAIKLLILTGCRMSEILTLKWEFIDLERHCLRLPDSKTGKKTVPLPDEAEALLKDIKKRASSAYVIPGRLKDSHLVNLEKPWRRLRALAELEDVRLHDLRHTYASVAAGLGQSLHMIGRLLGHTQSQTTNRYAHLAADPVRQAADQVSDEISRMLGLVNNNADRTRAPLSVPAPRKLDVA
ncbi:MAG: tyrosine-type recombinase/integrase [Rhodospirillaceae bacterium]|nr:tyrosine-type recombinase/integrase [Rhodospirillaceae bacterium]